MSTSLSNVFDVEPHDIIETTSTIVPVSSDNSEDQDFDIARGNYFELLDQGKAAINTAMRIAAESENPRAIEVLSGLLKNMADINRQLVQMNKDKQDVKIAKRDAKTSMSSSSAPQIQSQNTNIIMTGSLKDITKLISDATRTEN